MSKVSDHSVRMKAGHLIDYNIGVILQRADVIETHLRNLRKGCEDKNHSAIDTALHEIVGLVSGCRGRVQFCHGVNALKRELSSPESGNGGKDDRE